MLCGLLDGGSFMSSFISPLRIYGCESTFVARNTVTKKFDIAAASAERLLELSVSCPDLRCTTNTCKRCAKFGTAICASNRSRVKFELVYPYESRLALCR